MKQELKIYAIGAVFAVVVMGSFLFFGLRARAEGVDRSELAAIPRHEITDMMAREEWVEPEPVWVNPLSQYEMDLLAALLWAEGGDQPLPDGLCYICDVVFNRMDRWGGSVADIIYMPGQFSVVYDGALDRAYGNAPQVCYDVIISQLQNRWNYDIMYFSMNYLANGEFAFVHGTHWFGY